MKNSTKVKIIRWVARVLNYPSIEFILNPYKNLDPQGSVVTESVDPMIIKAEIQLPCVMQEALPKEEFDNIVKCRLADLIAEELVDSEFSTIDSESVPELQAINYSTSFKLIK